MDYKKEMRRIYAALGIERKDHAKGHKQTKKLKRQNRKQGRN